MYAAYLQVPQGIAHTSSVLLTLMVEGQGLNEVSAREPNCVGSASLSAAS